MNSIQITAFQPAFSLINTHQSQNAPFRLCFNKSLKLGFEKNGLLLKNRCLRLRLQTSARSSRYSTPVCLFGDKGKPGSDNWFKEAFESIKENLKEDDGKAAEGAAERERQWREMEEYYGDNGKGRGRGNGGDGGGDDGGEPGDGEENEGEDPNTWDEPLQVLASCFLLFYVYRWIVDGEETVVLTKDIIKLFFTWKLSNRLKRIRQKTIDMYEACIPDNIYIDPDPEWLEHKIMSTRTDWNGPIDLRTKYKRNKKTGRMERVKKPEVKKPPPKKVEKKAKYYWGNDGVVMDRGFSDDEDDEDPKILKKNQNQKVEMQEVPALEYNGDDESAELIDSSDNEPAEADGGESGEMIEDDGEVSEYDSEKDYSGEDNSDFEYDDDVDALKPEMEEIYGSMDSSEDDDDDDEDED